jgi:hypothetical protein
MANTILEMPHPRQRLHCTEATVQFILTNEPLDPVERMIPPEAKAAMENVWAHNEVRLIANHVFPEGLVNPTEAKLASCYHVCLHIVHVHSIPELS